MSLLITSSSSKELTNGIGIEDPASYTNHLKSTLTIPAGSEVAVQSVKIQRNPEVDYSGARLTNFWFGERLDSSNELKNSVCSFIPQENTIGQSLPVNEFAESFSDLMADALSLHPEINTQTASSASFCQPLDDSGVQFQGYQFQIAQVGASSTPSVCSDSSFVSVGNADATSGRASYSSGTMAAVDDDAFGMFKLENTEGPLGLFGGRATFDVRQANASDWRVGLTRSMDLSTSLSYKETGKTLGQGTGVTIDAAGLASNIGEYYEYMAESKGGELKLYHNIGKFKFQNGRRKMAMNEIVYYEKTNGSFTANNSDNSSFSAPDAPIASSKVATLTFELNNEKLRVFMNGESASNIVTPVTINASTKSQVPKPLGQTSWKLYPAISLASAGDEVSITDWQGRTNTTMKNNYYGNDWTSHCIRDVTDSKGREYPKWTGMGSYPVELDTRDLYMPYRAPDATPSLGTQGTIIHSYKGLNASVMDSYENLLIMGQSERYMALNPGTQSWQPNSADILGFSPSAIGPKVSGIVPLFGASFVSQFLPSTSADSSLFIRAPRLDLKTFNAGMGNPSKILYTIPRFDNTGQDSGALFFEANERLYVDCNNVQDILITDFRVDMVKKDETAATDLTGSTEVCFHFRKKASM